MIFNESISDLSSIYPSFSNKISYIKIEKIVTIYQGNNYTDKCLYLKNNINTYDFYFDNYNNFYKKINSISIPSEYGYKVLAYDDNLKTENYNPILITHNSMSKLYYYTNSIRILLILLIPGIRVFKKTNFNGEIMFFNIGSYILNKINWNNCINSIKIDPGYKITCYINNTDENIILTTDILNLNIINLSNKITSIKIEYRNTTDISTLPILSNLIVIYKNINFTGDFLYLEVGEYNLTRTNFNKLVNSIKIPEGYRITCFDDIFSENKIILTENIYDLSVSHYLFSNKISSIIVEQY